MSVIERSIFISLNIQNVDKLSQSSRKSVWETMMKFIDYPIVCLISVWSELIYRFLDDLPYFRAIANYWFKNKAYSFFYWFASFLLHQINQFYWFSDSLPQLSINIVLKTRLIDFPIVCLVLKLSINIDLRTELINFSLVSLSRFDRAGCH